MVTRTPRSPSKGGPNLLYVLGLMAIAAGVVLMLVPLLDRMSRPVGAGAVLIGVVMVGTYFLARLKAELLDDSAPVEPAWRKPAHGAASFPALPAPARPSAALPGPRGSQAPAPTAVAPPASPAKSAAPPPPEAIWSPEVFDLMTPQQFEAVCEALFAQGGFQTRSQSHGADGGVTVWLYSRNAHQGADKPAAVAQCKQWSGQPVDVREMHSLLELMETQGLKRGTYATASTYTEGGRNFAKFNSINALDGPALLGLIGKRTPEQQQNLLFIALGGP
jgi:hypothetical protein